MSYTIGERGSIEFLPIIIPNFVLGSELDGKLCMISFLSFASSSVSESVGSNETDIIDFRTWLCITGTVNSRLV